MLPTIGSVLIIEDGILVSLDLEDLFEDLGVRNIYAATSYRSAVKMLENMTPQLVTLDVDLGDATGEELVPILRERAIPHIVISGMSRDFLPPALRNSIFVQKPFTKDRLFDAITEAISKEDLAWAV